MNISWKQSHYKTTTLTEMKDGCGRLGELCERLITKLKQWLSSLRKRRYVLKSWDDGVGGLVCVRVPVLPGRYSCYLTRSHSFHLALSFSLSLLSANTVQTLRRCYPCGVSGQKVEILI